MTTEHIENEVYEAVWQVIMRRVGERAAAATELADTMLHMHGKLRRQDQELVAGDRVLNHDRDILPRVSRATSLGISLYLGNRRIASTSMVDAGDAMEVGGFADAAVVDTVLRRHEIFRGTIDIAGHRYLVASRPLYASDKPDEYGPVGLVEAFQDEQTFREVLLTAMRERTGSAGLGEGDPNADRMESVIHFIDDVARRLQLLALNGNIIAAQAGDHGRAFRVVCRELSSLAEQSKDAVAEVRKLTRIGEDDHDLYTFGTEEIEQEPGEEDDDDEGDEDDDDGAA